MPNSPMPTLLLLAAVVATSTGVPVRYRYGVIAGLAFSAMGDAFLMQSRDYFVAGLSSFLLAHGCYLWAFTSDSPLAGRGWPFALGGLVGVALVRWLWPGVPNPLRLPVVVYAVALLAMAAQATSRALRKRDVAAVLAAVGAAFFVISDSALAAHRFGHPIEWRHVVVLGTYFLAQGGIALSVVLHRGLRG